MVSGDFMAIGGNCFCFHARKEMGKEEEEEGRAGVGEEGGLGGGGGGGGEGGRGVRYRPTARSL